MKPETRLRELREAIRHHEERYYIHNAPEISDEAFDTLLHELERLEAEHPDLVAPDSPSQRVAGRPVEGFETVEHLVPNGEGPDEANVLVIANETVLGAPLLDRIRQRAAASPAAFLIMSPQSDPTAGAHPDAEARLKRAVAELRHEGIDVHGQVAHPDPFSAAMEAVHDERVDEIIVSTFEPLSSGWLRKHVVERLQKETGLPVEHVVVPQESKVTA